MSWTQRTITLTPRARGFHLITEEVIAALPEIAACHMGVLHLFCRHTSASLTLNENADPDVRRDLETFLNRTAPDGASWMVHTCEGPDDMPAHIKASLLGASVSIPVSAGRLALGTWQGITLAEHRDQAASRHLVATLMSP